MISPKNLELIAHDPVLGPQNENVLVKKLRIVNKPYKNTYTPGFNIQGKYLMDYGFQKGDLVNVEITRNQILIRKIIYI